MGYIRGVKQDLSSVDDRLFTITEVNKLVLKKFEQAGIVIAFPQRDIHFDSDQPVPVRMVDSSNSSNSSK
jgi:potassium-dependent mechanosensitive channel